MLNENSKSNTTAGNGNIIMTRIMIMKMGAPKVLALSPERPCFRNSRENAGEATIQRFEWLTAPLWKTLAKPKGRIEGEMGGYLPFNPCGVEHGMVVFKSHVQRGFFVDMCF